MKEDPLERGGEEIVGSMQMFFYDPKTKDTLPYYDRFPLVVVVGPAEKGFLWIKPSLPSSYTKGEDVRLINGSCDK